VRRDPVVPAAVSSKAAMMATGVSHHAPAAPTRVRVAAAPVKAAWAPRPSVLQARGVLVLAYKVVSAAPLWTIQLVFSASSALEAAAAAEGCGSLDPALLAEVAALWWFLRA
jgi:hypothetical protein